MHFFMTQALGIVAEDAVQGSYRYWYGVDRGGETTMARRTVGYIWVVFFLWWSTPAWFYPRLRLSEGDERERVLPFSLIRIMKRR